MERNEMTCRASIYSWLNRKAADLRYVIKRWEQNHRIRGRETLASICHFMQMKLRTLVLWTYTKYNKEMDKKFV